RDKLVTGVQTCALPISRSAAATDESTPPLMPTTIRSLTLAVPSQDRAEALELLGRRVRDFDAPAAIVADDRHARHERTLQCALRSEEHTSELQSLAYLV